MKILIVGIGALGSNLAALLACDLKGEHEITVLDMDNVEERNVQAGTQFYQKDQVEMSKVEALQYNIYKWYERDINIVNFNILSGIPISPPDLVIDCFDNHEARDFIQYLWMNSKWNLLHVGFSDQFTFAIEWAENYQVPTDITSGFDICTMPGAASFVKMVASIGSLVAQEFIRNGSKNEYLGNRLNIRKIQ